MEDAPYLIAIETDRAAPPPRRDYKGHKGHKEQGRDETRTRRHQGGVVEVLGILGISLGFGERTWSWKLETSFRI